MSSPPKAVLFDRDGTLVADVPYNGDPGRVVVMPGAREAVERLRAAGVATAVVSNQSGVGRGYLRVEQVEAVNRRVEELLGPLGPWLVCPHGPGEGCRCRKPAPGLIEAAAGALGVDAAGLRGHRGHRGRRGGGQGRRGAGGAGADGGDPGRGGGGGSGGRRRPAERRSSWCWGLRRAGR